MIAHARLGIVLAALLVLPQVQTPTVQGELVLDRIHVESLEETVTGESPDRTVAVYLPPSYEDSEERRYPVLYMLHGIGGTHADWTGTSQGGTGWKTIQSVMDGGIAAGRIAEMIVVAADQRTNGGGSFYTNSSVTGPWEDFTTADLVEYVDGTYRTHARASSRGVAGHSMGGYGAIMLGMKHPDVFQVVYALNAAMLGWAADNTAENAAYERAAGATPQTLNPRRDFWTPSILCIAQAFSPNPDRPPFFADLPFATRDGNLEPVAATHERWTRKMPLYLLPEYADNLRELRALRFDSGRDDQFTHIPATNLAFSERLAELAIPHVFEDYNGDHRNKLWGEEGRLATEVLPFFSRMLESE